MSVKETAVREHGGEPGQRAGAALSLESQYTGHPAHLSSLRAQALARANRDLAAARVAYHQGDRAEYLRLRRRGLRHQCLYLALRGVGP